jgi:hypothetical protein
MNLELTQLRTLQANLALKVSGHQRDLSPVREFLKKIAGSRGEVAFLDQFPTRWSSGRPATALLFRYEREAVFSAHLILHENRSPAPKFHIDYPLKVIPPTLIGLHYYHAKRRTVEAAQYLWSGAMDMDPDFEYIRMKDDSPVLGLAAAFYFFNHPIEHLPYPEGKKLALMEPLKEIGIAYIGELIQRDPKELKEKLGETGFMAIRNMLHPVLTQLKLSLGNPLPGWRPPAK